MRDMASSINTFVKKTFLVYSKRSRGRLQRTMVVSLLARCQRAAGPSGSLRREPSLPVASQLNTVATDVFEPGSEFVMDKESASKIVK